MDNTSALKSEFKSQELKKKLLDCLDREARQFSEIARDYFNKDQLSKEDKTGLLKAVINTVDHVMSAGDWDSSLFLHNTLKPLMQIKSDAELELSRLDLKADEKAVTLPAGVDEVEVYISLFQSDGYNIGKWAMQMRSLERYMVGRPVYQNEMDVEKRIRLRASGGNEAYVVVVVKKKDVMPQPLAGALKDQFDHLLLTLKERAVSSGRITAFIHQGVRYYFVDGQLIKG